MNDCGVQKYEDGKSGRGSTATVTEYMRPPVKRQAPVALPRQQNFSYFHHHRQS